MSAGSGPGGGLHFEMVIAAPQEIVFHHFTDPARLVTWMGRRATLDPREGGAWSVDVNGRDVVAGRYLLVEPPTRLVFTWAWRREGTGSETAEASTVEVTLEPEGAGTRLRLVHRDLPVGLRDGHAAGWSHYLARLALASAGANPGPDPLDDPGIAHGR